MPQGQSCPDKLLLVLFHDDLGVRSVLSDALDAVQAGSLGLVTLAGGDDLAVARLEAEAGLARLVGVDLELGVRDLLESLNGLVLELGDCGVGLDAGYAVLAVGKGGIDFAGSDDFAVSGLKVENETGLGLLNNEFAHNSTSFLLKIL